jgi:hypothetical protein
MSVSVCLMRSSMHFGPMNRFKALDLFVNPTDIALNSTVTGSISLNEAYRYSF